MCVGASSATNSTPLKRFPDLQDDAYYAHGYEKQIVMVVPSRDLVIVRLGFTKKSDWWDENAFFSGVASAFPLSSEEPN